MVLIFPLVVRHMEGQRILTAGGLGCSGIIFVKLIFGQGFVETEESEKLADIYFHLLLPSQSEVQRGEIGKHQLMLERGNIRLPLRLLHPQNPGRRVERRGKYCSMIQRH